MTGVELSEDERRDLGPWNSRLLNETVAQIAEARADAAEIHAETWRSQRDQAEARADALKAEVARLTARDEALDLANVVLAEEADKQSARAAQAEALVEAGLGLVGTCTYDLAVGVCGDLVGATFPNGTEFTADLCCLPCRLRAVLGGAK